MQIFGKEKPMERQRNVEMTLLILIDNKYLRHTLWDRGKESIHIQNPDQS
jgi:hypothetical protein